MTTASTKKTPPKYLQIYEQIQRGILNGEFKPGERLPSFSELRTQYGAMPATAERAYARLEQEKLVIREARRGVFVAPRELARTGTIGFISHPVYPAGYEGSPYMQALLGGIREGCQEQGIKIMLMEGDGIFGEQQVDGLLLNCDKLEAYAMGIPDEVPHVMLLQHVNDMTAVTADDFGGAKLATSHLINLGHRRIACLMEETKDISIQRRGGYQAALQEVGITISPDWLKLTKKMRPTENTNYLEWGRENMRVWLAEGWLELGCTAIVAQNDHAAIGVMQTLQEAGVDVPGQVSVIGFDGTEICDLVRPRLTSVQVPLHQIGREAIRVLCEQIQNGSQTPREISLPVKLRAGDSVSQIN